MQNLFKVYKKDTRAMSDVVLLALLFNFEHTSHIVLAFSIATVKELSVG